MVVCFVIDNIDNYNILKHFRQFVQSDWFLPGFISHDKDTVWNVCITHAPGWIDPLECRDLVVS